MPKKKTGLTTHLNINLRAKPKETVGNIFVKWGITSGKLIIVTTELVALSALFYRFSIDRKIIDLNDQIKREQILIDTKANQEKEFRSVHKRLEQVKLITTETNEKVTLLDEIINTLKNGSYLESNIAVTHSSISITGTALTPYAINDFIEQLKLSKKVDSIKLDEITGTDEGIQFSLSLALNTLIPDENAPLQQASESAVSEPKL